MIEEPVQKRSGMFTNLNCADVQRISSSDMRDKCIMIRDAAALNSIPKSRSDTASSEFSETASKPSNSAVNARSIG